MIALFQLDDHIKTLRSANWGNLFNLLDEMDSDQEFGELTGTGRLPNGSVTLPYYNSTEVIRKFLNVVHGLNILPSFDWPHWIEGKKMLNNKSQVYSKLEAVTLCKLLTVAIRADRFHDGFLISCFARGIIQKIVAALKNKAYQE